MIKLKRAYETPSKKDGKRILVERLWSRGISKESAKIQAWLKELAPSAELRKWYQHDVSKWDEFQKRYQKELETKEELINELEQILVNDIVTFIYAARDEEHNSASVLKMYIENRKK
ncbi:MAG: DUF488 family protein [Acidobacteriota bacterium]|nr:MAG: DUF488 family protein [Acidobacteriota bacterium]